MFRPTPFLSLGLAAALMAGCGAASRVGAVAGPSAALAEALAKGKAFAVDKTMRGGSWAKTERLEATAANFPDEPSRPNGKLRDQELVAAFGSAQPESRYALLHYAQGWDRANDTLPPVILVHGAIVDANSGWVKPHGEPGLAPHLAKEGRRVFAITYAHRHGDNLLWAAQLAWAIARVKEVTGAKEVDLVAHSKGTVAARALASGLKLQFGSYQKDVRRLVLVGGPMKGIDFTFRHPIVNLGLYPEKDDVRFNAPMSWSKMIAFGLWTDIEGKGLTMDAPKTCFPGQAQMLSRWSQRYPLGKLEQDWYTTYEGGQGFVSRSSGIDAAIEAGGNFMEKLAAKPLDAGVELAVLAGDAPTMKGILNEKDGPSDGLVFVESSTATADLTRGGAKLLAKEVLHENHMDLVIAPKAQAWVAKVLSSGR